MRRAAAGSAPNGYGDVDLSIHGVGREGALPVPVWLPRRTDSFVGTGRMVRAAKSLTHFTGQPMLFVGCGPWRDPTARVQQHGQCRKLIMTAGLAV